MQSKRWQQQEIMSWPVHSLVSTPKLSRIRLIQTSKNQLKSRVTSKVMAETHGEILGCFLLVDGLILQTQIIIFSENNITHSQTCFNMY